VPSVQLASEGDASSPMAQLQDELALPVLLGRQQTEAQTLPSVRSRDEVLLLRRRRRAQTTTIRDSQVLANALASPSDTEAMHLLRPPRVILTTAAGLHSMCLPNDCQVRMQFVSAGLPAGPLLPRDECCAICLDAFQTRERVQLMAFCRHVFHAGCVKRLLHSRLSEGLAAGGSVSCPLCRGSLLAGSPAQLPHRERSLAVTIDATLLDTETSDSAESPSCDITSVCLRSCLGNPADDLSSTCASEAGRVQLRRTLTAPTGTGSKEPQVLVRRSATTFLEALGAGCAS